MGRVNTKTGVSNLALSLIKQNTVASIEPPDKNSKAAKLAAQFYDDTRREVLSETVWDFAIKRALISASAAPAFGWGFSYELPSDFIRIATIGDEENPLTQDDYIIENGFILCDEEAPLKLRYVYDLEDIAKFSPKFLIAFVKKLSSYLAAALTGSLNMAAGMGELASDDISNAKGIDAQQTPPRIVRKSRWARAKVLGATDRTVE